MNSFSLHNSKSKHKPLQLMRLVQDTERCTSKTSIQQIESINIFLQNMLSGSDVSIRGWSSRTQTYCCIDVAHKSLSDNKVVTDYLRLESRWKGRFLKMEAQEAMLLRFFLAETKKKDYLRCKFQQWAMQMKSSAKYFQVKVIHFFQRTKQDAEIPRVSWPLSVKDLIAELCFSVTPFKRLLTLFHHNCISSPMLAMAFSNSAHSIRAENDIAFLSIC